MQYEAVMHAVMDTDTRESVMAALVTIRILAPMTLPTTAPTRLSEWQFYPRKKVTVSDLM